MREARRGNFLWVESIRIRGTRSEGLGTGGTEGGGGGIRGGGCMPTVWEDWGRFGEGER